MNPWPAALCKNEDAPEGGSRFQRSVCAEIRMRAFPAVSGGAVSGVRNCFCPRFAPRISRMKKPSHSPSKTSTVLINLSDGPACEIWIRKVAEALSPETRILEVLFVSGGQKIEPSALLSLRNALLRIPDTVFVRTVAMSSLSPFACVAWLIGDERWIAADARVWIPQLPEPILRGHPSTGPGETQNPGLTRLPEPSDSENDANSASEDMQEFEKMLDQLTGDCGPFSDSHRPDLEETDCGCRQCRQATELRTLSSTVNDWFPSWEYAGVGLDVADLVELRVIRSEWVFGGKTARRSAARHVESPAENEPSSPKEVADDKVPVSPPEMDAAPDPDAPAATTPSAARPEHAG